MPGGPFKWEQLKIENWLFYTLTLNVKFSSRNKITNISTLIISNVLSSTSMLWLFTYYSNFYLCTTKSAKHADPAHCFKVGPMSETLWYQTPPHCTSIIYVSNFDMRLNCLRSLLGFHPLFSSIIFKIQYPIYVVCYLSWHWNHSPCYQKPPNEVLFSKLFWGGKPQTPLLWRRRYATSNGRCYLVSYY